MEIRTRDAVDELNLPAGFRFHPTDEELVVHYLCRKASGQRIVAPIIAEVDLYKYDPWLLPEKALFGSKEWYFFTPRDRKYPNGSRPNRAAGSGYWKATGADKPVRPTGSNKTVGIKKALVFYSGKAPKGVKTDWIMHEYRLVDTIRPARKIGSLRLDDWVLCRLYNKKSNWMKTKGEEESFGENSGTDGLRTPESDIEHDTPLVREFEPESNLGQLGLGSGHGVKEDSEWFVDMNLDELNGYLGPVPLGVDFSFANMVSPTGKCSQYNSSLFF